MPNWESPSRFFDTEVQIPREGIRVARITPTKGVTDAQTETHKLARQCDNVEDDGRYVTAGRRRQNFYETISCTNQAGVRMVPGTGRRKQLLEDE